MFLGRSVSDILDFNRMLRARDMTVFQFMVYVSALEARVKRIEAAERITGLKTERDRLREALTDLWDIHTCIGMSCGTRMLCTCHSIGLRDAHKQRLIKIRAALAPASEPTT